MEDKDKIIEMLIERWHQHSLALTALMINLVTIIDHADIVIDGEEAQEVLARNIEAIIESARRLDGDDAYTQFLTELTEAMAQVFEKEDEVGPNRNLI